MNILVIFYFCFCLISVSPESVVIPIVSCIFGFPLLALLVICCLRKRAKLARERDRRRNYDLQDHAVSLVRFSPIHRLCESDKLPTFFNFNQMQFCCNTFLLPVSPANGNIYERSRIVEYHEK